MVRREIKMKNLIAPQGLSFISNNQEGNIALLVELNSEKQP